MSESRPAFYALDRGGWRDYVTLLHLPYTGWHLANVVIGGCLAPVVSWPRLGLCVLAFALALGIGAHALDELNGRPLRTSIPSRVLVTAAVLSVGAASAIGIVVAVRFSLWILVAVAVGAAAVPLYNLELLGGRFHNDLTLAFSWAAFPTLTGYLACAGTIALAPVAAAVAAGVAILAQRRLSTQSRWVRRGVSAVEGVTVDLAGEPTPITRETLGRPAEQALALLTISFPLLALALAASRAGW